MIGSLLLTLLILAPQQHGPPSARDEVEEKAQREKKANEEAALKSLAAFREATAQARTPAEFIAAMQSYLVKAKLHPLVRSELGRLLGSHASSEVRIAAAAGLARYKKDEDAARLLSVNARTQKSDAVRLRCLEVFGTIAPFRSSSELAFFFSLRHKSLELILEAVKASEKINSIRILPALIDFLGELEKEGKAGHERLAGPTRTAIQALWKKCDSGIVGGTYKEGVAHLEKHRRTLAEIQQAEDKAESAKD